MKRNIIIFSSTLVLLSLLFFDFTNWNNTNTDESKVSDNLILTSDQNIKNTIPDLYYGVDTRFTAIKKADIEKATTLYNFLNEGEKQQIATINSVEIIVIKNNQQSRLREFGTNEQLTEAQIKLIKSLDYFNHFTIRTEFQEKDKETGKLKDRFFGPHITITPDKQAVYIDGKESLINYLKDNSKENMNVIKGDKLGAIKVSFIITKEGTISNVKHDAMTTGYPSLDEKFIELIKNIPGKWSPAENSEGEKMDYEFVFTFGPRDGC